MSTLRRNQISNSPATLAKPSYFPETSMFIPMIMVFLYMMGMPRRTRRLRMSPLSRDLVRENVITKSDLVYPIFVQEESGNQEIPQLPGISRIGLAGLLREVHACFQLGLRHFILFPKIEDNLKDPVGTESFNPNGLIQRALRLLKSEFGNEIFVFTDVALDPYNSLNHDGIVKNGQILNDETLEILRKQALSQVEAGSDCIAPSDMMDGRVAAIRENLDAQGFVNTPIMSYSSKYASSLYGPFRSALGSTLSETFENVPADKNTYQMDPYNRLEAFTEGVLDEIEGADILLVKPGIFYLDIVRDLKNRSTLPIASYQVSGEYAMIKLAAQSGVLDLRSTVLESLASFKRAGSSFVLTYFAKDAAGLLDN